MNKNYKVRGMSCNSCKVEIEKGLKKKNGIKVAHVNLKTHSIHLEFDESKITVESIKIIFDELGYELGNEVLELSNNVEKKQSNIWITIGIVFII